jgi:hypothetical protein
MFVLSVCGLNCAELDSDEPVGTSHDALTVTLRPIADTMVREDAPTSTYGTATKLNADASPRRRGLFKFDVTGIPVGARVTKVTFRFFATSTLSSGVEVRRLSDNGWSESSATWNGLSPAGGAISSDFVASPRITTANQYYDVDITSKGWVTGNGLTSLALTSSNDTNLALASKELSPASPPQLVVTYDETDGGTITPSLSVEDVTATEGNSSGASAGFEVTLSAPSTSTVTVAYATTNETALAGSDYVATTGTLSFAPGETSKTVAVPLVADTTSETTETFTLSISGASGATIADGAGVATILDDDGMPPPPSGSATFALAGDIGGNSMADDALRRIPTSGAEFFVAAGDLSYNEVTPESGWCDFVKARVGATFPFQVVGGNHEEDGGPHGRIMNFAACMPDRMSSTGQYARQAYFDHKGLVRVITISPDLVVAGVSYDYVPGNANYQWLTAAIDGARSASIPWVIVVMHKNCITTGAKSCEIGAGLQTLLFDKRVDLVLQGHEHNYQRSKQLRCATANSYVPSCVADDGADDVYPKGAGTVVNVVGAIARSFYATSASDSEAGYFAKLQSGQAGPNAGRGFLKVTVDQAQLSAELVPIAGSTWVDRYRIVK